MLLYCAYAGSRDKSIIIWDQDNGVVAQTLKDHEYQVSSLGILEDGSIVSASLDKYDKSFLLVELF